MRSFGAVVRTGQARARCTDVIGSAMVAGVTGQGTLGLKPD